MAEFMLRRNSHPVIFAVPAKKSSTPAGCERSERLGAGRPRSSCHRLDERPCGPHPNCIVSCCETSRLEPFAKSSQHRPVPCGCPFDRVPHVDALRLLRPSLPLFRVFFMMTSWKEIIGYAECSAVSSEVSRPFSPPKLHN